jgi:predicted Zn-dependent peptidase
MSTTTSTIETRRLACGMDLIVEPIAGVRSVGMSWLVAGGSAREPSDQEGLGAMWSELLFRGAGGRDAREHADALDRLGASRNANVQTYFMRLSSVMLGARVHDALPLLADMVTSPAMDASSIEPVRDLCVQSIEALADDPHERVMLLAREKHVDEPLNRSGMGRIDSIESLSRERLTDGWRDVARPQGSAIAFAGDVDADAIESRLNALLEDWEGEAPGIETGASAPRGYHHQTDETNQVHIAIAHDAPKELDEASMCERVVIAALSGGMSGRLFTEVREKRGLVYSVNASYGPSRDFGRVAAYAGTTPERAQETLDVMLEQLQLLSAAGGDALRQDEFDRAVVGMKSNLVMSGESTSARAGALGTDWFRRGAARTLQDVADEIDALTLDQVNAHIAQRELGALTIATIGPAALQASL